MKCSISFVVLLSAVALNCAEPTETAVPSIVQGGLMTAEDSVADGGDGAAPSESGIDDASSTSNDEGWVTSSIDELRLRFPPEPERFLQSRGPSPHAGIQIVAKSLHPRGMPLPVHEAPQTDRSLVEPCMESTVPLSRRISTLSPSDLEAPVSTENSSK